MQVNIKYGIFSLSQILILTCQVVLKSFANRRHHIRSLSLEWQEKATDLDIVDIDKNRNLRIGILLIKSKKPEEEVDNLNAAENGEASEKARRASNQIVPPSWASIVT